MKYKRICENKKSEQINCSDFFENSYFYYNRKNISEIFNYR